MVCFPPIADILADSPIVLSALPLGSPIPPCLQPRQVSRMQKLCVPLGVCVFEPDVANVPIKL